MRVAHYQLTAKAEEDLREIGRYIAVDNLRAATKLLHTLEQHFILLAENRNLGRARRDIAPDMRYSPVKNYLIFYRHIPHGIEIVRVVHSRRNLDAVFDTGDAE